MQLSKKPCVSRKSGVVFLVKVKSIVLLFGFTALKMCWPSYIVTGISGNTIVQDGYWAGAVAQVPVDAPTRGYATFMENTLDAAA